MCFLETRWKISININKNNRNESNFPYGSTHKTVYTQFLMPLHFVLPHISALRFLHLTAVQPLVVDSRRLSECEQKQVNPQFTDSCVNGATVNGLRESSITYMLTRCGWNSKASPVESQQSRKQFRSFMQTEKGNCLRCGWKSKSINLFIGKGTHRIIFTTQFRMQNQLE